jgi:hypothetical protein
MASAATPADGWMALHTTMNTAPMSPVASDCHRVGQRLSQKAVIKRVNTAEVALTTMAVMDRSSRVTRYESGTSPDDEATSAMISCAGRSNRRCCRNAVMESNWSGVFSQLKALCSVLIGSPPADE